MATQTIVKRITGNAVTDMEIILEAAEIIKRGGLVAFPTETVYGLGANAFNPQAVKKIFEAKGRPQDNPLIAHISVLDMLDDLARDITFKAIDLAKAFWPGPLTMIFFKKETVPDEVSCNLPTIAVRFPENEIARLLIEKSGVPVAAPSANLSGRPSPTLAEHVIEDLYGKIDMIIDGGQCAHGIESTIVDLTLPGQPVILRPGSITTEMMSKVISECCSPSAYFDVKPIELNTPPKAPGMKYTHYAPKAKLILVSGTAIKAASAINRLIRANPSTKTGVLATTETKDLYDTSAVIKNAGSRETPEEIGYNLFRILREFDKTDVEIIYSEFLEEENFAASVMNRLKKAAGYEIINV
ncbi:MAG: threonylcarbamoyl-AMP synthase [Clostridiales bacterium]|jgi:L-threonylcarbamoyladenylate synthase|nr:threonylcarbamoyl-AMP synthase [Clostridiales bacterium]